MIFASIIDKSYLESGLILMSREMAGNSFSSYIQVTQSLIFVPEILLKYHYITYPYKFSIIIECFHKKQRTFNENEIIIPCFKNT